MVWYYGVALLLSFPIAIFVYSTIENPIRRIKSKPFVVYGLITLLAACIGLGQIIKAYEGFPSRDIAKALNFSTDFTSSQHLKKANIWGVDVAVTNKTSSLTYYLSVTHIFISMHLELKSLMTKWEPHLYL